MCFFERNTKREYRGETSWSILVEMLGDLLADDGQIRSRQELVGELQVSAQAGDSSASARVRVVSDQDVVDLTEDVDEAVIGDGAVAPVAQAYAISAAETTGGAAGATSGVTTDDVLEESASGRHDAVSGGCV